MISQDVIGLVTDDYKNTSTSKRLKHNNTLFNIYEGDLLTYVLEDLRNQLSDKSYEQAKHRVAPVNVLKRLIEKLSKIYAKPPTRNLEINGSISSPDNQLLSELHSSMDINTVMTLANEFFNLFKTVAIEPFLDQGMPKLRVIPADRFLVLSQDPVNPLRPTVFSKLMAKVKTPDGNPRQLFYTYTSDSFCIHDDLGEVYTDLMAKVGNADGVNPLGRIPVLYVNRSRHELIPQIDSDTLSMSKLIAILLSDLNFAVMFQCFCIMYGINVTNENLKFAPNVFWNLKSDAATDQKPEIGVLKPEVDVDKVLTLIKTELGLWMQSRNIKPGVVGDLDIEGAKSGIAKIVDEMDTSEDRQKQVPYFMHAESELFELTRLFHDLMWIKDPEYKLARQQFSQGVVLKAMFSEQKPQVDTSVVITDQTNLFKIKMTTRKRFLQAIYPDANDDTIDALLEELEQEWGSLQSQEEQALAIAKAQAPGFNTQNNMQPEHSGNTEAGKGELAMEAEVPSPGEGAA